MNVLIQMWMFCLEFNYIYKRKRLIKVYIFKKTNRYNMKRIDVQKGQGNHDRLCNDGP